MDRKTILQACLSASARHYQVPVSQVKDKRGMIFDDIPIKERVRIFSFEPNLQELEPQIKLAVKLANKYINETLIPKWEKEQFYKEY